MENESIATRAVTPSSRSALAAEAMAMSASASASGSMVTAQSAKTSGSLPLGTMMKKLDGVAMPSARPTDISPASMTRAVGWVAPATSASASPAFTAIAA